MKRRDEKEKQRRKRKYRRAKKQLRKEIKVAKLNAWQELINEVDIDPWGLPYLVILKRLRKSSLGLTETMDEKKIDKLLDSLFPRGTEHDLTTDWAELDWNEEEWGIELTYKLRKKDCDAFFISFRSPYNPVSSQTIGRWVKLEMGAARILRFSLHILLDMRRHP